MSLIGSTRIVWRGLIRRGKESLGRLASASSAVRRRLAGTGSPAGLAEQLALDAVPARANNVSIHHRKGVPFLQSEAASEVLRLNDSAVILWQLCDGRRTALEITAILAWRFQEDEKRVEGDILAALRQFEAHGFIDRSRPRVAAKSRRQNGSRPRPKVYGVGWPFSPNTSSNSRRKPKSFDWTDNRDEATVPLTICIGHGVPKGLEVPGTKIAWLLESPAISQMQGLYDLVRQNLDQVLDAYYLILSPDREFCKLDPKIRYHPAGSNLPWMTEDKYRIYPKTKLCSMIASAKQMVEGHRTRLEYAEKLKDRLDLYGGACGSPKVTSEEYILDKSDGLAPYMFSVTMENCRVSLYYTEKITDCFVTGTVPIYWGSDDIGEIFDEKGILRLDDDFDVATLSPDLYAGMMPHIKNNFEIASFLEGSDDLLFDKYIRS